MSVVTTTHRVPSSKIWLGAALSRVSRSAHPTHKRRVSLNMETPNQDELKAHLMATNEEFRSLAEQHSQYHKLLEELQAKPHLTWQEEAEENRLKKLKLRLKDQ